MISVTSVSPAYTSVLLAIAASLVVQLKGALYGITSLRVGLRNVELVRLQGLLFRLMKTPVREYSYY